MSSLMPNDNINKLEFYLNGNEDYYPRRIPRNECSSTGSFISSPPHLASNASSNNIMAIVNNHRNSIANSSAAFSRLTNFFITDSATISKFVPLKNNYISIIICFKFLVIKHYNFCLRWTLDLMKFVRRFQLEFWTQMIHFLFIYI